MPKKVDKTLTRGQRRTIRRKMKAKRKPQPMKLSPEQQALIDRNAQVISQGENNAGSGEPRCWTGLRAG